MSRIHNFENFIKVNEEKELTTTELDNESKIEFVGDKLYIDGKEVVIDNNYKYVKLGGKGVERLVGAFYPGDMKMDQLQGIHYEWAASKMKNLLKRGYSLSQIDKYMSSRWVSPISGPQSESLRTWNEVKKYLGLKIK